MTYHSRALLIDTREQKSQLERIEPRLEALGFECIHTKLWVGDYQLLENPFLVVDRKKDLQEIIGNVTHDHKRFHDELERAQNHGIKLVILIEHGGSIKSLDDLETWVNPRLKKSPKATTGKTLKKILTTMNAVYGVEFEFCSKMQTAKRISEILEAGVSDG